MQVCDCATGGGGAARSGPCNLDSKVRNALRDSFAGARGGGAHEQQEQRAEAASLEGRGEAGKGGGRTAARDVLHQSRLRGWGRDVVKLFECVRDGGVLPVLARSTSVQSHLLRLKILESDGNSRRRHYSWWQLLLSLPIPPLAFGARNNVTCT
eukprot:401578-Pleurochrysis_carterae.AAC.1